jgi:predicted nucleotidyltransferase
MKKDSDVDIIVVSKRYGRKDVFRITPKLYGIWHEKQKNNYPVDILLLNEKEFEKLRKQVSIVSEAVKEGIEI